MVMVREIIIKRRHGQEKKIAKRERRKLKIQWQ